MRHCFIVNQLVTFVNNSNDFQKNRVITLPNCW